MRPASAGQVRVGNATARGVFVMLACLYALSIGRGFYSSDGDVMFQATAAIAQRGTLALAPDPGLPQIVAGHDRRYFSKYDPGLSMAMVPLFVAGDGVARANAAHRTTVAATAVLIVSALAAAGAVAGAVRLGSRMAGVRRAAWIAAAAGIASPLWWYGRVLFAEALLACALTWTVALVHGGTRRRRFAAFGLRLASAWRAQHFCCSLDYSLTTFRVSGGHLPYPV